MTQSWNAYLGECAIATNNAPLQSKREAELVHAGDLFASYLSAFLCNFSARFHPVAE